MLHRPSLVIHRFFDATAGILARRSQGSSAQRRGFTLLELLMVVLIVGILAALLSTAFSNTKAKSRRVACMNNMRQLQVAWWVYLDENDDLMPLNRTMPGPRNEHIFGRRNSSNSWVVGSPKEDTTPVNLVKGSLFPYTGKSVGIYRCPQDRSTVVLNKDQLRTRSYSMSAYLNGDDEGLDPRVKTKGSELINPSPERVFVFIEEHESSAWLGSFRVLPRERFTLASGTWTSTPSDRHNQGCNITFADTHVEYWKWYWPKKSNLQSKLTSNSHEIRDLRRLQDSVPKP
jgi:prepilin-type N-terminal cleavage/methylation domain-containing protein/prepilin-type processing-associated H-X9-DG protein